MLPTLLDTDVLSEVLKQRDNNVLQAARVYLGEWRRFTFSVLTRYEILRGAYEPRAPCAGSWLSMRCAGSARCYL